VFVLQSLGLFLGLGLNLVDLSQELLLLHSNAFLFDLQLFLLLPVFPRGFVELALSSLQFPRLQLERLIYREQLSQVAIKTLHLDYGFPMVVSQIIVDGLKFVNALCLIFIFLTQHPNLRSQMLLSMTESLCESLRLSLVLDVLRAELHHLFLDSGQLQLIRSSLFLHCCCHSYCVLQSPIHIEFLSQ
jgi:hypothetical protein